MLQVVVVGDKVMDIGEQGLIVMYVDISVIINNNQFVLNFMVFIVGFVLLDKVFKDFLKFEEEFRNEREEKFRLLDKIELVIRVMLRKEMEIVGWFQNLLKNFSGEVGGSLI